MHSMCFLKGRNKNFEDLFHDNKNIFAIEKYLIKNRFEYEGQISKSIFI